MFVVLVTRGLTVEGELADLLHEKAEFALGVSRCLAEAESLVGGTPEAAVLVPVQAADDPVLDEIAGAVGRGVQVGAVLASDASALRTTVFSFGAKEALVAPFDREQLATALGILVGRPLRRAQRCEAPFAAIVAGPGIPTREARVVNLSRGGVALACEKELPIGAVLRIAIQTPPPHRLPLLFARTIVRQSVTLGEVTRAAFVGLTAEERGQLDAFVTSMGPEVEDVGAALAAVRGLSLDRLRRGLAAGVRLPALTPLELAALEGKAVSDLCGVAVARCRALLLSSAVDVARVTDQPVPANLPFDAWWKELRDARDVVEILLERATNEGRKDDAKPLRELLSRVEAAASQLDRTSLHLTGRPLEKRDTVEAPPVSGDTLASQPAATNSDLIRAATEDAGTADRLEAVAEQAAAKQDAAKPAARRGLPRWAVRVVGLIVALLAAIGIREWLTTAQVEDPSRTVVADAPVFVTRNGIRIRSLYVETAGTWVAVVDSSWWKVPQTVQDESVAEIARKLSMKDHQVLWIRDYAGEEVGGWYDHAPPP